MKQPAALFSFKKNVDVQALPDAIPAAQAPAGAPRKTTKPKTRQVSCYLTEEEFSALLKKLDGRPVSAIVRNLVLRYVDATETKETTPEGAQDAGNS